jgi:hypothetical protein
VKHVLNIGIPRTGGRDLEFFGYDRTGFVGNAVTPYGVSPERIPYR